MGTQGAGHSLIGSLRYFNVGTSGCTVCGEPSGVARMAVTATDETLITMLCDECAGEEIDGMLERREMITSADGNFLVSRRLAEAVHARAERADAERPTKWYTPWKRRKKRS